MSKGKLRNKVVVITGASSGFGRGTAIRFAKDGAKLVLAARRESLLDEVAEECRRVGGEALTVDTDVSDPKQVERLAQHAITEFGHIDVWINNAGVGTIGRYEDVPIDEHEQVIRTNLLGTMYGSYAALKQFRKQHRGTIINVGSFAGVVNAPFHASYSASKFGIRGLDLSLRQELKQFGERNIHVCTVEPVSHDTPFFEHAGRHTGHRVEPMGHVYDPEKVVDTIYKMTYRPKAEVIVGGSGRFTAAMHTLAPRFIERQMGKMSYQREFERAPSGPEGPVSVFDPVSSGRGEYGGWRKSSAGKKAAGATLAVVIPAAIGLAFWARSHRGAATPQSRAA